MRYHAIALHLSEPETSISRPSLCWLSGEYLSGTTTSGMNLVLNHMLEPLIVSGPKEYHDFQLLAAEAVIHDLVASQLIALLVKSSRDFLNGGLRTLSNSLKRRGISLSSSQGGNLGSQTFNQVANSHSRRDSVRVDDEIRDNTFSSERKVLLTVEHSDRAFLSMTTRKLIADLRYSLRSHLDLCKS